MNKITDKILLVTVICICISFFLPWINVMSAPMSGLTKLIAGKAAGPIDSISGFDVPILANGPDSRLMISIVQIFNPSVKHADKKSWGIWGIPLLAIAIFLVLRFVKNPKWFYLVFGILGCLIFCGVVFKLKTTDLDKMVLQIKLAFGLWLWLWAYLCLGLVCLYHFYLSIKNPAK